MQPTLQRATAALLVTALSLSAATASAEPPWTFGPQTFQAEVDRQEGFDVRPQGVFFEDSKDGPTALTLGVTSLSLATVLATELLKPWLAPAEPRVTGPNALDAGVRNTLHWESDGKVAATISDALLFGVFGSSVFWTPLLTDLPYITHLEINLETLLVAAALTQTTKFAVGRERPYAFYDSLPSNGRDDNLSFFSGHSSLTMSLATANAMVLSDRYPRHAALAWSVPLLLSLSTAYLRIAADKHYFTDVLVGLGTGVVVGWAVSDWRLDTWR